MLALKITAKFALGMMSDILKILSGLAITFLATLVIDWITRGAVGDAFRENGEVAVIATWAWLGAYIGSYRK
jgi:hypothetical protein